MRTILFLIGYSTGGLFAAMLAGCSSDGAGVAAALSPPDASDVAAVDASTSDGPTPAVDMALDLPPAPDLAPAADLGPTCRGACVPGEKRAGACDPCSEEVCTDGCAWSGACQLKAGADCEYRGGWNFKPCPCVTNCGPAFQSCNQSCHYDSFCTCPGNEKPKCP